MSLSAFYCVRKVPDLVEILIMIYDSLHIWRQLMLCAHSIKVERCDESMKLESEIDSSYSGYNFPKEHQWICLFLFLFNFLHHFPLSISILRASGNWRINLARHIIGIRVCGYILIDFFSCIKYEKMFVGLLRIYSSKKENVKINHLDFIRWCVTFVLHFHFIVDDNKQFLGYFRTN